MRQNKRNQAKEIKICLLKPKKQERKQAVTTPKHMLPIRKKREKKEQETDEKKQKKRRKHREEGPRTKRTDKWHQEMYKTNDSL